MSKVKSIIEVADAVGGEVRTQLDPNAGSVALAIALGRMAAEAGIDLQHLVAMAECAHKEQARAETADRAA